MKMKAPIFVEPGRIVPDEKPIPEVGPLDALIRITTTTILRHRRPHPEGRVSLRKRADRWARACRRYRKTRLGGTGLQ